MRCNIVAGNPYWVCYQGMEAYQVTPQYIVSSFDDDRAWSCLTPRGRGNIWASMMYLTEIEAIDESLDSMEQDRKVRRFYDQTR
jgi:hypothetical protein